MYKELKKYTDTCIFSGESLNQNQIEFKICTEVKMTQHCILYDTKPGYKYYSN